MKFTKIRLIGLFAVDFPVTNASPSDVYILKDSDGLGPPEVDVSISDTLNAGGVYQGRRPQNREVTLRVGLNPDHAAGQSASDLRSSLYGMLTPGSADNVQLQILNGEDLLASTVGYVSKLEISPFSKDPEVQITLPCLKPYFEAPLVLYVDPGSKVNPLIVNSGTAPSGFSMAVTFTSDTPSWTITDATGKKMQFTYAFKAGDTLIFDTRAGSKSVTLSRIVGTATVVTNIIYALSSDSVWHQLYGGNNVFTTSAQNFNWGDVFFLPLYWGI